MVITARTRNAVTEQSVQGFESLRFRQQALTKLVRAFVLYTQGMRTRGFDTCANRGDPAGVSVASLRFRQKNRQVSTCRFFYPSRRLGISSRRSRGYHQGRVRPCISSRASVHFPWLDDIQRQAVGDIQFLRN